MADPRLTGSLHRIAVALERIARTLDQQQREREHTDPQPGT